MTLVPPPPLPLPSGRTLSRPRGAANAGKNSAPDDLLCLFARSSANECSACAPRPPRSSRVGVLEAESIVDHQLVRTRPPRCQQRRVAAPRQPQRSSVTTNIGSPPLDQCHSHWSPSRPDAKASRALNVRAAGQNNARAAARFCRRIVRYLPACSILSGLARRDAARAGRTLRQVRFLLLFVIRESLRERQRSRRRRLLALAGWCASSAFMLQTCATPE